MPSQPPTVRFLSLAAGAVLGAVLLAGCTTSTAEPAAFEVYGVDATDILQALDDGDVTSVELVTAYQARIAAYEFGPDGVNAVTNVNLAALAEAAELDAEREEGRLRGPLHGIPVIVKDVVDVAGLPTTGSRDAFTELMPTDDATQVELLRAAGAIVLAKSNVVDIDGNQVGAIGGITRNPYDRERHAGFSSGGAGAAIAAGFAPISLGEDTFGSVRIPASLTNLVGLRPTLGLSSADGLQRLTWAYDTLGPITTSVRDAALVLDVTAAYDESDPVSDPDAVIPEGGYVASLSESGLEGKRIGLVSELLLDGTSEQTATSELILDSADEMRELGADVVEVTIPATVMSSFDAIGRAIIGSEIPASFNAYLDQQDSVTVPRLDESTIAEAEIETARAVQDDYREGLLAFMAENELDALLYPAMQQPASEIGTFDDFVIEQFAAKAGVPALTVPAGFVGDLPVGLELLGLPYSEADLLSMGFAFEQATDHRKLPASTPALG